MDAEVILDIMLTSLVGGLFCLDRVLIQVMISRPVVIAPAIGILLGDPYTGLIIGAILELLWMDRLPIGIYIPPNDSIAAVFAAALAILAGQALGSVSKELITFAVLIAIPFGLVAKAIDVKIVESNNLLSDQALEAAREADIPAIERKVYLGLFKVAIFYVSFLFLLQLLFVPMLISVFPLLPAVFKSMLFLMYYFLPILGMAVALNTIRLRGAVPVFCAMILTAAIVMEFFYVF
jgi:mannose PTS system EIIC component